MKVRSDKASDSSRIAGRGPWRRVSGWRRISLLVLMLGSIACGQEGSEPAANEPDTPEPEPSRVLREVDEEMPELLPDKVIPWQESLLELPAENGTEQAEVRNGVRPANQGGGLFPPAVWPLVPELPLGPLGAVDKPPDGAVLAEVGTGESGGAALSAELTAEYFKQRPEKVFLDPQHLLSQAQSDYMESMVRRWLNDGKYRATFLLFGEGQELPAEVEPSKLVRDWFGVKETHLLVCGFLNQPERTRVFFVPDAVPDIRREPLRAALGAAMREAGRIKGGVEQLQRFCYKTKIRLHRLEQEWGVAKTLRRNPASDRNSGLIIRVLAAISMAALVLASILGLVKRKKNPAAPVTEGEPIFLPEQELHIRLGAPHGGGFSAVITFPPAVKPRH